VVSYRSRNATGPTLIVSVRVSEHAYRLLRAAVDVTGESMASFVEQALVDRATAVLDGRDPDTVLAASTTNDKRRRVIDQLAGRDTP
jgi:uncharacterized protein (DUF1778 family)